MDSDGRVIGMHTFGASAPLKGLQKKFGFEPDRASTERIDHPDTGPLEVARIPRGEDEAVMQRRGRDHAVEDRSDRPVRRRSTINLDHRCLTAASHGRH